MIDESISLGVVRDKASAAEFFDPFLYLMQYLNPSSLMKTFYGHGVVSLCSFKCTMLHWSVELSNSAYYRYGRH